MLKRSFQLAGSALLCIALLTTAGRAQKATAPSVLDYYPLKQGNSWTLNLTIPGVRAGELAHGVITLTVTKVLKEGAYTVAYLEIKRDGKLQQLEKYRILPNEIVRVAAGWNAEERMVPPIPIIRLPMKAEQSWKWVGKVQTKVGTTNAEATFTILEADDLPVPAGTFRATQVHSEMVLKPVQQGKVRPQSMPLDYWFVPGTGLVQQKLQLPLGTLLAQLKTSTVKK